MIRALYSVLPTQLILCEDFDPWAASIAKRLASEKTEELVEVTIEESQPTQTGLWKEA